MAGSKPSRKTTGERAAGAEILRMDDVVIKVRRDGPYLVTGPVTLTDADGNRYDVDTPNVALCRCGASQTKPFCDGSHRTNGFSGDETAGSSERISS
jgi:CDGSH-type Zn-finger protein